MINKSAKRIFGILAVVAVLAVSNGISYADEKEETVYHPATFSNFSKTYWRFSKFDLEDDYAVDEFMRINECDIYTEFYHNEFEWNGIRDATRNFLSENEKKFPAHYQFMKEISLDGYDFEKQGFMLLAQHGLRGVKRFEIPSDKLNEDVCGRTNRIDGYPRVAELELSRPLTFDFLPLDQDTASELIDDKMQGFEDLEQYRRNQSVYEENRIVYLNAKVKVFALKPGEDARSQHGYSSARLLGILEGIEVFADREKQNLLYSKDFRRKKRKKSKEIKED